MLSLIVAFDQNQLIGSGNALPWHLPADLKHFKALTMGKPILMGRKTFESIGRALPGRDNWVISRSDFAAPDVFHAHSLEEAIARTNHHPEVMIIGGASIYEQALALVDRLYITKILHAYEGDAWFPPVNWAQWQCISQEHYMETHHAATDAKPLSPAYQFETWQRVD